MEVSMIKTIKISLLTFLMLPTASNAGIWDSLARFLQSSTLKEKAAEFAASTALNAATIATSSGVEGVAMPEVVQKSAENLTEVEFVPVTQMVEDVSLPSMSLKSKMGIAAAAITGVYLYSKKWMYELSAMLYNMQGTLPERLQNQNFYWFKWLQSEKSYHAVVGFCNSPAVIKSINKQELEKALVADLASKKAFIFKYSNNLKTKAPINASVSTDNQSIKEAIESEKTELNEYIIRLAKQITSGYESRWYDYSLGWIISSDKAISKVERELVNLFKVENLQGLSSATKNQIDKSRLQFIAKYASYNPVTNYAIRLYFDAAIAYGRLCALEEVLWPVESV